MHRVLITSYETLRKVARELTGCCDILVCDEGHRLKSSGGNKTIDALEALGCSRRILLTGTPVQNDLDEFYGNRCRRCQIFLRGSVPPCRFLAAITVCLSAAAMLSFVNPDVLGPLAAFKRVFSGPIEQSRDRGASAAEVATGQVMRRRFP